MKYRAGQGISSRLGGCPVTRLLLKRLLIQWAENAQEIPHVSQIALSLEVSDWQIWYHIGRMHDDGELRLVQIGRRRGVVFPDGSATR